MKGSQDYVLNKANMTFTGPMVKPGTGAWVLPAAVPAPALPQKKHVKLQTNSGGLILARGLETQPVSNSLKNHNLREVGTILQPSQDNILCGKLGDPVIEKEFESCSVICNAGMIPCAL